MPQFSWKLVFAALMLLAAVGDQSKIEAQNVAAQPGAPVAPAAAPDEDSPLLIEPKTRDEFYKAAILMHRLARPNLARQYLQKLVDTNPNDAALLKLRDTHGPAGFLRLSNAKELRPLSSDLMKRINAAFRKRGADPKYIDTVLDSLSGTVSERRLAVFTLRNTGDIVVPRILQRIAATNAAQQSALLQQTLTELGTPAVRPLLAALDSSNDRVRIAALTVVGLIGSKEAPPFLWYFATNKSEPMSIRLAARKALARIYNSSAMAVEQTAPASVASELKRNALMHFKREFPWKIGADKKVTLWSWDAAGSTVSRSRTTPMAASMYFGARFARQALAISSENQEYQALFLAMSLAASADPKWEKPLPTGPGTPHDMALAGGTTVVNEALRLSMKYQNSTAAIASLIALRQIATKSDMGRQSPLVAALDDPVARVRFAAAGTIMHIDPDRGFSGSSRVVSILARALTSGATKKGLVVNASRQKGATVAGLLGEIGFEPAVTQTGREGFRTAAERSDIDLILLQLNTIRWPLSQTIANLRADARTSSIPIAIYGPDSMRYRIVSHLENYSRITYIADTGTSDGFSRQLNPFMTSLQGTPLTPKQRGEQREAAVYWLAQLASGHREKLFNLRPAEKALVGAMYDPALTANALLALSAIPTRTAQVAIQEVTVNSRLDAKLRESAALQLAFHIRKYGLLISAADVRAVRLSLTNATDPGLATALSAVMGSLKPNPKRVGDQLRGFPLPKVPAGN